MSDSSILSYQAKLAGDTFELVPGDEYDLGTSGIALPKDSPLTPAIRTAMAELVEAPAYAQINENWGLPESNMVLPAQVMGK